MPIKLVHAGRMQLQNRRDAYQACACGTHATPVNTTYPLDLKESRKREKRGIV
ncbi:MAG: hypothetical protein PHY48_14610 [Candidatus Cloacimonetes bacterium]|nr:hypothetical protein [Candidatus Cloacimonadota bacterium]